MVSTIDHRGLADASPYHSGELSIQLSANVLEEADRRGRKMLTPQLAAAQQSFFAAAPFVVTSTTDDNGLPWAGLITGERGFIRAEEGGTMLNLNWTSAVNNTRVQAISDDKVGLLAIDFESRRRNRLNATLHSAGDREWSLSSDQGYGNCPKYINPRPWDAALFDQVRELEADTILSEGDRALLRSSDTFFIATSSGPQQLDERTLSSAWGNDISHRGGEAGFLRLENEALVFEDYSGNNMFNTLGNLQQYPFCGLLLIDFDKGDLLQLSGGGKVEATASGRQTRVTITSVRRWRAAQESE